MSSKLPYAENFRGLIVYQKARALSREIFQLSRRFPKEETYSLTDQVRRSSRSVGAQIAEAWGKRRYEKHFVSKLTDADAKQLETQHWIETASDCEYITPAQAAQLLEECVEIGRMLNSMISKPEVFHISPPKAVREAAVEYFVERGEE